MVGCSSLTSQNVQEGSAMYWRLYEYLVPPALQTVPRKEFSFPISADGDLNPDVRPPGLLRAYLSIGAHLRDFRHRP